MVEPKLIDLLSKSDIDDYLSRLFSIRHEWRSWPHGAVNVMGATSYVDAKENKKVYYKIKDYYNKVLLENFSDLYDKLLLQLTKNVGPSKLEESLAYPGFHIIGSGGIKSKLIDVNLPDNYINMRHKDHIYNYHLDILNQKYRQVDTSDNLSFTLSFKLPREGSGLSVWSDGKLSHLESDSKFALEIKKNGFYKNKGLTEPEIITYKPGSMFLFSGNLYHQIAPIYKCYEDDMRITLQGHAVLCDNVWRWYF